MREPNDKRVIAFVDGQNLFYAVKNAFGYDFPNYDPVKLAKMVCEQQIQWNLIKVYFYTGVPSVNHDSPKHKFWTAKLASMGKNKQLVQIFTRPLVYHQGVGREKGIDIRLALDVMRLTHEIAYDVALIFSQDQDFTEVASEIRHIAINQHRWIKVACAYPVSPYYDNNRGIQNTDWIRIDKTLYDQTIDTTNYRFP